MAFLLVLAAMLVAAALDPGWLPANTASAQQHDPNLRADVRGVEIRFSWNGIDGATRYHLNTPYSQIQVGSDDTSWTEPVRGTPGERMLFELAAIDSDNRDDAGSSAVLASDSVTITVPANLAPTANAGRDASYLSAEMVTLAGRGADSNRDTLTYRWSQVSGPDVAFQDADQPSITFTTPTVRNGTLELVFLLAVSDGRLSGNDTVSVSVSNSRPVADAGSDQVVTNGTVVTLDAGGSGDRDGPLAYLWEQTSGTEVSFDNSTERTAFDAPGSATTLVFRLVVNDTQYADSDAVRVRVVENVPPTARISAPGSISSGVRAVLNGSGSSDPDGDGLSYRWTQTAGDRVSLSGSGSQIASFTVPHVSDEQQYKTAGFQLSVSDGTFTDTGAVEIYFANTPPLAYAFGHVASQYEDSLVGGARIPAAADYGVPRGVVFVLNGSESLDSEDDTLTYRWKQTGGPTVRLSGANTDSASFNTEVSEYAVLLDFELAVRDMAGNTDTASLTIGVEGVLNPTADAGRDIETRAGSKVVLDGSGSMDPVGDNIEYYWEQTSGDSVNLADPTSASPSFTAPSVTNATKTLAFQLTVHVDGTSDTDTVNVYVVPPSAKPLANAGSSRHVGGGANVTLDGSGSTGTGTLSYEWRQTTGTRVTLSDTNTASPSFTAPNTTRYTVMGFTLTVRDSNGNADTDTVRVTAGRNAAPMADAGRDINAFAGSHVALSGSGSDPERDSLTYSWTQTGGTDVDLNKPSSSRPTFTAPDDAGTLTFRLTVRDSIGNAASDTVNVNVVAVERGSLGSPVLPSVAADAGPAQVVATGSAVRLDGSGSTGSGLSYSWTKTGGPSVALSNSTVKSPTFTAPSSAATLTFRLTVTSGNLSDTDTVRITVASDINRPPSANAGSDANVRPGEAVALSGSGSDPDGGALSYRWAQIAGRSVDITGQDKARASFTAPDRVGAITFRLTATDTAGLAGSDTVTFTVVSALPVADAGPNQSVTPGTAVRLDGRSSYDPDGDGLSYSWRQTGGTDVSLSGPSSSTASFRAPAANHDTLTFELTVSDRRGNSGTDTVTVTIEAIEPTANAGPDQGARPGETVYLDGSGSVDGGGLPTYAWTQTGGGTGVSISGADGLLPSFTAPDSGGTLTFRLTVSNGIYSSSDTVRVVVDANDNPRANAGSDKSVKSGARVELRGSASDPDNADLSYSWRVKSGPGAYIADSDTLTPYFTAPDVSGTQTMVVEFEADDGEGGTDTDTVRIAVSENGRPAAAVSPPDQFVPSGTRVTLDASGSSDPDGDRLTYRWTQVGGEPAVSLSGSGPRVSFTAPSADTTLYFAVTVSDGALDDETTVIVDVADNVAPRISVGSSSMRVASNSTFTLAGTLTDTDGDVRQAWWEQTSGPSVTYVSRSESGLSRTDRAPVVESGTVTLTFDFVAFDNDWTVRKTVTVTVYAG